MCCLVAAAPSGMHSCIQQELCHGSPRTSSCSCCREHDPLCCLYAVHLATSSLQLDAHQAHAAPHLQARSERKAKNQLRAVTQPLPAPAASWGSATLANAVTGLPCWAMIWFLRQPSQPRGLCKNQNTPKSKDKCHHLPLLPAQGKNPGFTSTREKQRPDLYLELDGLFIDLEPPKYF